MRELSRWLWNEIAMRPLLAAVDCGVNVTLQLTFCPPFRVTGYVRPLTAKPAPDAVACVTISFVLPEFVKVAVCVWPLPIGTLPKLILEGFAVSCPDPATAEEVSERSAERIKNTRNPHEIPHLECCLTIQPLMPC